MNSLSPQNNSLNETTKERESDNVCNPINVEYTMAPIFNNGRQEEEIYGGIQCGDSITTSGGTQNQLKEKEKGSKGVVEDHGEVYIQH